MRQPQQLGFGFDQIEEDKRPRIFLPKWSGELPTTGAMLEKHNAAMLAGDEKTAMEIRTEANRLAVKLNDGEPGILGGPDAPGYRLMNGTAATRGTVPMWGQKGEFPSVPNS
jgi:hypothetical protein